jgi:hypothetical protein
MHINRALSGVHVSLLIVCGAWLVQPFAVAGQATTSQPSQPKTAPHDAKPVMPPQMSAHPSSAPAKPAGTPRDRAWEILDAGCGGDKTTDRTTAVLVLGLIPNDPRSARLAEKALADEKLEVRSAAAAALGNMQSRRSIPKLRAAMGDPDPSVALAAAHSLDLMHDNSAFEVYYAVLNGERKTGKGLIASKASMLHDPKKMAELGFEEGIGFIPFAGIGWGAIKAIRKDDASPVRAAAARVLARDPDPATTKALIEATGDNSWIVQVAALEALAKRGDPSALQTAAQYMSDEKSAIKFTAAAAVIHLTAINGSTKKKQLPLQKNH